MEEIQGETEEGVAAGCEDTTERLHLKENIHSQQATASRITIVESWPLWLNLNNNWMYIRLSISGILYCIALY